MDIIIAEEAINPSLLKFKIGGAALVFEKVGNWKHHFKSLIPNACRAVRENRAQSSSVNRLHMGNILYAALVHAIVQMIDIFVQERMQVSVSHIDLQDTMRSTGVWKQDAKLDAIVEVAANFLALYKDVNPSDSLLKFNLLVDFEVVWREVIDHYFDKHRLSFWEFVDGGRLCQHLLDPEPYAIW
ncbi:hypothetical protein MBLNU13_g09809t1 [Cladosporium sp. NU13]